MPEDQNTSLINVNLDLQQSNNYIVKINGNKSFLEEQDIEFYIKHFNVPDLSINAAEVAFQQNTIKFPAQGKMLYGDLSFELMIDDNLRGYLELSKWMHRLKNPQYLLKSWTQGYDPLQWKRYDGHPALKEVLEKSNQYPIEYRDIDVYITDTNHQIVLKFTFQDAWIYNLSGLELNSQTTDALSVTAGFYFLLMVVRDANNNIILPPQDKAPDGNTAEMPKP